MAELAADMDATAAAAAPVVVIAAVVMGAWASGSVMLVSWDVLMVELSKRELASGEMDRLAEGCDAGGESSSASSTDAFGLAKTFVSFTGEALDAVAEHSFFNAGEAISASSRDLFLGVSLRAGEGVACLETVVFLRGLPPFPSRLTDDDDGDLVTLTSSAPRARLLVGVAVLIFGWRMKDTINGVVRVYSASR